MWGWQLERSRSFSGDEHDVSTSDDSVETEATGLGPDERACGQVLEYPVCRIMLLAESKDGGS